MTVIIPLPNGKTAKEHPNNTLRKRGDERLTNGKPSLTCGKTVFWHLSRRKSELLILEISDTHLHPAPPRQSIGCSYVVLWMKGRYSDTKLSSRCPLRRAASCGRWSPPPWDGGPSCPIHDGDSPSPSRAGQGRHFCRDLLIILSHVRHPRDANHGPRSAHILPTLCSVPLSYRV